MDQTLKPNLIPPKFALYAEKHQIFELYQRLLSELIINKPEDPLIFLIDFLKKDKNSKYNHVLKIDLLISAKLIKTFSLFHFSSCCNYHWSTIIWKENFEQNDCPNNRSCAHKSSKFTRIFAKQLETRV